MTEQQWLGGSDPMAMLTFLFGPVAGLTDEVFLSRKSLLLACACFSRLGELLPPLARRWQAHAVQAAEGNYAKTNLHGEGEEADIELGVVLDHAGKEEKGRLRALLDLWTWTDLPAWEQDESETSWAAERKEQAALVRDLFGNPFRPVTIKPDWLTCNDGTIPKLAQMIYEERRFRDLPVLADALEQGGCTDAQILDHCRGLGPHVRGCWVIDSILGKS